MERLAKSQIEQRLVKLSGWQLEDNKLVKEYVFRDFLSAFEFMSSIAPVAESMSHHPEWFNVYNKVKVWLTTHEVGGVSENDFSLARAMDSSFTAKQAD